MTHTDAEMFLCLVDFWSETFERVMEQLHERCSCGQVSGRLVEEMPSVRSAQLCLVFISSFHPFSSSSVHPSTAITRTHTPPTNLASFITLKYYRCNWQIR